MMVALLSVRLEMVIMSKARVRVKQINMIPNLLAPKNGACPARADTPVEDARFRRCFRSCDPHEYRPRGFVTGVRALLPPSRDGSQQSRDDGCDARGHPHARITKNDNGNGKKVFIPYPAGHNVSHAGCLRKVTVAMHAEALEGLGRLYRLRFYARKRRFHYAIFACHVLIMILTIVDHMIGIQSAP